MKAINDFSVNQKNSLFANL